ncbi:MAG TPA: alanine racemase [Usitatibacter sp.]
MSRPILATISRSALRHNYGVAKRAAARSKVFAVVKANGYGHGRERVARILGAGTDGFAMVELEGAVATRESGYPGPVLLLEGFFESAELPYIAHAGLATVIHDEEQLRMLEATPIEKPIDVFFKVNTGMNRLGFRLDGVRPQLDRLRRSKAARSITLMTHFATSEEPEGIAEAMRRFDEVTKGIDLPRSLANTAAIFSHPGSHADVVRLGIGLYGATPFPDRGAEALGLEPAMTLTSRLISIQELEPGEAIGYGATFRAEKKLKIGVVACGYADGYPRHAPSGTPVLVGGVRAKTAGRVSMDMITVDLAGIPDARVGTPVTLWGEGMPIDDVATPAGTVGYELMCALGQRVPVVEGN